MTEPIIVRNLTLQLSGNPILDGISLAVKNASMTALIGPNGSGKTTLLNCLSGLNRTFAGTIQLAGHDITSLSQKQIALRIAYLHQHMPAELKLTVYQVVELGLIPNLSPWASISKPQQLEIEQAIAKVGLTELAQRSFNTLSGGEKQRALIAKTMVQKPDILLMDEPTNHLDIKHQIDILTLVKSMQVTTITCIHDINLALAVCDDVVCLKQGKIAFQKPTSVIHTDDFVSVYGVDCQLDTEPFHDRPRLSVKWN